MRYIRPKNALALVGALGIALSACQQSDQELPFGLAEGEASTKSVSATTGGVVSAPPNLSVEFPAGALSGSGSVTITPRLDAFPYSGLEVPGTAFDITADPGVQLLPGQTATVELSVPPELLQAGDDLLLVLAVLHADNSVTTSVTSYDVGNGILRAEIDEIGPVAAVIANDAISVGDISTILGGLGGGAIVPVSPPPAGVSGPALSHPGGAEFTASCAPDVRSCFTSGIVRIYVDSIVRDRLGDELILIDTQVDADFDFFSFATSVPDSVVAEVRVQGALRARLNRTISSRQIGDDVSITSGDDDTTVAEATAVTFGTRTMSLELTSEQDPEALDYEISGVGTSDQLTVQVTGEIEFLSNTGPSEFGTVVVQLRLTR